MLKKFIGFLLAFVTAISLVNTGAAPLLAPSTVYGAETKTVTIHAGNPIPSGTLNYNGNNLGPSAYFTYNGVTYPAFCVDPNLPGAESHPNGEYPVKITGTNMDPKITTVLHNTLPYKTKSELPAEYRGLNDAQIYAATKAAVRAVGAATASQYPNDNLWAGDPTTVAFAKYLINLAKYNTEDVPTLASYGTANRSGQLEDENHYYWTMTVQSNHHPLKDGTKIELSVPPGAPAGTFITDENDNPVTGVDNYSWIKIKIPKSSVPAGTGGSFTVDMNLTIISDVILFGEPTNPADVGKYQRYEISMTEQEAYFPINISYEVDMPPDEPDEPNDPNLGGLKILKYDNVTGRLTPGAIFEVKGLDVNNRHILFQVQASAGAPVPGVENGVVVTTANGQISVTGLPAGKYLIAEIAPPPNYDTSPDAVYSKVVEVIVTADPLIYAQVAFRNNPFGTMKITKIDAVTGQAVPDVWLRIRNPLTGLDITRKTDANGIINLIDLPQGNYEISETNPGENYELNTNVLVIPVRWGRLSEAVFQNQPHTSLEVMEINTKTNSPVPGAVFVLKNLSTGAEWTLTTLADGKAVVNNIPAGNYNLTRINRKR